LLSVPGFTFADEGRAGGFCVGGGMVAFVFMFSCFVLGDDDDGLEVGVTVKGEVAAIFVSFSGFDFDDGEGLTVVVCFEGVVAMFFVSFASEARDSKDEVVRDALFFPVPVFFVPVSDDDEKGLETRVSRGEMSNFAFLALLSVVAAGGGGGEGTLSILRGIMDFPG
jgi:hypothetical protein